MTTRALHLLFGLILLAACGGDPAAPDAARMDGGIEPEPDGARLCERDSDCDDELFCTGAERCAAGVCAAGTPPCDGDTPECDEEADRCAAVDCSDGGDTDGDRHRSIACGGDDCDDDDPLRFAGAHEICDPDDRDEDCDPSTYGFRDADMDGDPDATCCNGDNCGTDCDDMRPGVNSTNPEVCGNGFDDDCDGTVDEGLLVLCYRDADSDGFGDASTTSMRCACDSGWVNAGGDCHDGNPEVRPGATGWHDTHYTTPSGTRSFDYDCSGTAEPRWTRQGMGCMSVAGGCVLDDGWCESFPPGPNPACGREGNWCTCVSGATCRPQSEIRLQECR